ncbi:hypothetical protein A0H81_11555 [Grifola frondosa]|uniref:Uncharacterized protein n=1 Tax=Grifola frondosa TaxID=5627 RepID=A0A1C7LVP8_GRIFR|nr:hypothetical protein A0H81_11555 [Grifola frondosa]
MLGFLTRRSRQGASVLFDVLPTVNVDPNASSNNRHWLARCRTTRCVRLAILALVSLALLHWLRGGTEDIMEIAGDTKHAFPPLYEKYHQWELRLPQHDPNLPLPEGRNGKYIWMANHVQGSGWGNAMQELLLSAHLAYSSGRSFVFNNYTWNGDGSNFTDYNGKLIPSRIPLAALIRGPVAGGTYPAGVSAPRAVVKEYWDEVCPEPTVMMSDVVTKTLPYELYDLPGDVILDAWVKKLNTSPRCVEIDRTSQQIFNIWMFGSVHALDIWPSLSKSPILSAFRWSQLVEDAFTTNREVFSPTSFFSRLPFFREGAYPYEPIPGLLVLHVRRGDFVDHCLHFAKWSSTWNGFNQFPELPDHFVRPPALGWGEATEEGREIYLRHCFPEIEQIVERVTEVRATPAGRGLKNVYIMTNGARPWVAELKAALKRMGEWETVASSRDVKLNWEQQYVAQAVDMLIGQRAQVIIGNGFSSLTSNIVMLRMAKGLPPDSNRFW